MYPLALSRISFYWNYPGHLWTHRAFFPFVSSCHFILFKHYYSAMFVIYSLDLFQGRLFIFISCEGKTVLFWGKSDMRLEFIRVLRRGHDRDSFVGYSSQRLILPFYMCLPTWLKLVLWPFQTCIQCILAILSFHRFISLLPLGSWA